MGVSGEIKPFKEGKSPINLLKTVKSNYILKFIFSLLYEKSKLKMIIYKKNSKKNLILIYIIIKQ